MAHQAFKGSIPDDRLYCPRYDMWIMAHEGDWLIGASSFGLFLAGEVIAFTAKPKGAEVNLGRGLGTIECRKTVLAVHSPISFILLEGNESIEERPALLNKDPYQQGWMIRARATRWEQERHDLIDAEAYRAHILNMEPEAEFV